MPRNKAWIWLCGHLMAAVLIMTAGCRCPDGMPLSAAPSPDIIPLDALRTYAPLERPTVLFPHDIHAEKFVNNGSCVVCHPSSDGDLVFTFLAMDHPSKRAAMNAWHRRCIGCHQKTLATEISTGPLTCGQCHIRRAPAVPEIAGPAFYDVYHELHEDLDGGCGLCHHEYDAEKDELYYAEGAEVACRECHQESAGVEMPSARDAAHRSCVNCHLKTDLPVNCAACHEFSVTTNNAPSDNHGQ